MVIRSASGTLGGVSMKHLSLVTVYASRRLWIDANTNVQAAYVPKLGPHLGMITPRDEQPP
jgi:hypothetical protein